MKHIYKILLILIIATSLSGCGNQYIKRAENQHVSAPKDGMSQVVFIRKNTSFGGAIRTPIVDINNDFHGIVVLSKGYRIAYQTTPGKHLFMVASESGDFVKANLEANKTYYILITPRLGVWRARFTPNAVTNRNTEYKLESENFKELLNDTKLVEATDANKEWFATNSESLMSKYNKYYKDWLNNDEDEINNQTLLPADGTSIYTR